jgi:hypothetical protein
VEEEEKRMLRRRRRRLCRWGLGHGFDMSHESRGIWFE